MMFGPVCLVMGWAHGKSQSPRRVRRILPSSASRLRALRTPAAAPKREKCFAENTVARGVARHHWFPDEQVEKLDWSLVRAVAESVT